MSATLMHDSWLEEANELLQEQQRMSERIGEFLKYAPHPLGGRPGESVAPPDPEDPSAHLHRRHERVKSRVIQVAPPHVRIEITANIVASRAELLSAVELAMRLRSERYEREGR